MLIAERFLSGVVKIHGKHPLSTDGGTWYQMSCRFLGLKHHLHSSLEKSIIERTMQYIKDRTESFDDYFPCRKENCKLKHVLNWMNLFVSYITRRWFSLKLTGPKKSISLLKLLNSNLPSLPKIS
jgi:putative transposase